MSICGFVVLFLTKSRTAAEAICEGTRGNTVSQKHDANGNPAIQASVGMHHNGTVQCYNLPDDQQTVADLLDMIQPARGGTGGSLSRRKPVFAYGRVDLNLFKGIQAFQTKQFGGS